MFAIRSIEEKLWVRDSDGDSVRLSPFPDDADEFLSAKDALEFLDRKGLFHHRFKVVKAPK